MQEEVRYSSAIRRLMYSNKVYHSARRVITWTSKIGLTFEHNNDMLGRSSEQGGVEYWGSGKLRTFKGYVKKSKYNNDVEELKGEETSKMLFLLYNINVKIKL